MTARLASLLILAGLATLPGRAAAQRFEGAAAGTLDCPARSLFESGSTQVRGVVRNGLLSVGLGPLTVSGRIVDIGPQPAVRLDGSAAGQSASFDGLVIGGSQLHARGILNDRPCNLNLTLSVAPSPPGFVQAQPARVVPNMDGPWQGMVTCPLQGLGAPDQIAARGSVADNVLHVDFASIRAQGRIFSLSPRPGLRIEGGNNRGVGAGFDATTVTPQRIEGRGLVGGQPCTIVLTPARLTPPTRPTPPPAPPPMASPEKPPPSNEPGPPPAPPPGVVEKPPPSNAPPPYDPEPARPPPVASTAPRPPPAPPTPAPGAPRPPAPSPGAADQLACALAGTCPTPAPR